MKIKKTYITPLASFDDIEAESNFCAISGNADHKPSEGGWGGDLEAKSSKYFGIDDAFDDPFASPAEEDSNEFQYTLDF